MQNQKQIHAYLPDEKPPLGKLLLYALQQVIVMFPATIAVALITGFQVSTTIFASGLATLCFVLITKRRIPMYYGSSFSYLSAVIGLMTSEQIVSKLSPEAATQLTAWLAKATPVMPAEAIAFAQFGIVMSGLVSVLAGILVKYSGRHAVEKILPPTITGSIALVIGLTLADNALGDAAPMLTSATVTGSGWVWIVSLATLLSTILFSRYLKGFLSQLPLLLGAAVGCAVAGLLYAFGGADMNLFRAIKPEALSGSL
jgi:uracil permease